MSRRSPWGVWVLAAALAGGVLAAWQHLDRLRDRELEARVAGDARRLSVMLTERLAATEQVLLASAGLFEVNPALERLQFRDFVEHLQVPRVFPGVLGVGFVPWVPEADLARHEAAQVAAGLSGYQVRPPGPRPYYAPVTYLEPSAGPNRVALGFDIYSEARRRAAMDQARDSATISFTAPITLVQSGEQDAHTGLLAFLALYRRGVPTGSPAERRAALVGWVDCPLQARPLLSSIFSGQLEHVHLRILDAEGPSLLFDSAAQVSIPAGPGRTEVSVAVGGRTWLLRFQALPGYAAAHGVDASWEVKLLLLVAAGAVFFLARRYALSREAARAVASSLVASEDRYRAVVERVTDVVLQLDEEGRITFLNAAWTVLTGSPVSAGLGQALVERLPPDSRPPLQQALADLAGGRLEVLELATPFVSDLDGERYVELRLRRTAGAGSGFSGTLVDLTARRQAELALAQARDAAESSARAKGLFLATMSHEIRTPMNGVLGMSQVLLGTALTGEQADAARTIAASAESLLVVINDILDYSKIEAGALHLESSPVALRSLVDEVTRLLGKQASAKGLRLEARVDAAVPEWIRGDGARLRQVLLNLAGNAVKFTGHGEVRLEVGVAEVAGERWLHLRVVDTGIGIAPEVLPRLFAPFQQAEASITRRFGGTGLGLTISRRLVELMGGSIDVTSVVGQGSTFTVTIRCVASEPGVARPSLMAVPSLVAGRKHVLIVDDNRVNRMVLARLLDRLDISSDEAEDGLVALARLKERPYDLVFMDLHMPELDGMDATRRLRAGEAGAACRAVPVVALTADALAATREACAAAGMDAFLSKPVHLEELSRCVKRLVVVDAEQRRGA